MGRLQRFPPDLILAATFAKEVGDCGSQHVAVLAAAKAVANPPPKQPRHTPETFPPPKDSVQAGGASFVPAIPPQKPGTQTNERPNSLLPLKCKEREILSHGSYAQQ